MTLSFKKFYATLLMIILLVVFSVPYVAFAQVGTLGTENPVLSATFKDGDDAVVDGNELEAGTYTVNIKLSGMKSVSVFQITADISNIAINSVSTIADADSSFSCGAIINENNSFVAILASENSDASAIEDGATMVTLNVTVSQAGDFADYFVLSTNPDLTFIEADYGDGYDDAYVCSENSDAKYANLTYDMSPSLEASTFDVKGQIMIAVDEKGNHLDIPIRGITVSVDDTNISAVTDENGYYTLSGLAEGTYTMSISGETTIDRKVTLIVTPEKANENAEITVNKVGIVICDYNKDGFVNPVDVGWLSNYMNGDYNVYADFNGDGYVNPIDVGFFSGLVDKTVEYDNVAL